MLAKTDTAADGSETREYPYGNVFAHVVGYSVQGKSGIESLENYDLLTSDENFLIKLKNEFQDKKYGRHGCDNTGCRPSGSGISGTGREKGAVVVMEPKTGKILAMVSKPDFDPNTVESSWNALSTDENGVLLNRATQGSMHRVLRSKL